MLESGILEPMKRLRTTTVALLVFHTGLFGQSGPTRGSLTGTVLCDDPHGPARGANVYLQSPTAYRPGAVSPPEEVFGATTGMDGSFIISRVAPGEYYVMVVYAGYISAREYVFPGALSPEVSRRTEPVPSFVQRVKIVPGGRANITIQLERGASITGSVTYTDGAPVPYLALTPELKLANGEFADMMVGASHTDSSGHYRIDGLPDGAYVLLGGIEGPMVPVFGGDKLGGSGLIVFSGGGVRPSKARVVAVKAPHEYAGVDIAIPLVGVHEVSGSVTGPDGHRLNHGTVRLYPTGEPRFSLATPVKADGTFSFGRIPQDSYTVLLQDATDLALTPKSDGVVRYQERTVVQKYQSAAVVVNVADVDLTDVILVASPVR
jgi:hypothetical protein